MFTLKIKKQVFLTKKKKKKMYDSSFKKIKQ